ncbi:MAG: selenide, water dikinase SelD [Dehalococcoidales bacterium]|nr:selenide, water dikinase SelD [Dehalococcoidales bacterium]
MGPGDLNKAICDLPKMRDPNLIRGIASPDDAGVYRISDEVAIIQTIDFFTPIVDDPYTFGQIAVANALSDVYAMGGKPLTAMNVVCFPVKSMDISVLKEILRGGVDKILEAGALLVGGHSIEDDELKYGLSVTGTVHPKRLLTNAGARAGDRLILTKPLGTGIISTAIKAEMAGEAAAARIAESMATLNKEAAELMQEIGIHAVTDITGFGLIGHTAQMADNSRVGITIFSDAVPVFPEVADFAEQGLCPGGLYRNREFYSPSVIIGDKVPAHIQDILFDPQTSGGLLISLATTKARRLLDKLNQAGINAAIVGEVTRQPRGKVTVR